MICFMPLHNDTLHTQECICWPSRTHEIISFVNKLIATRGIKPSKTLQRYSLCSYSKIIYNNNEIISLRISTFPLLQNIHYFYFFSDIFFLSLENRDFFCLEFFEEG